MVSTKIVWGTDVISQIFDDLRDPFDLACLLNDRAKTELHSIGLDSAESYEPWSTVGKDERRADQINNADTLKRLSSSDDLAFLYFFICAADFSSSHFLYQTRD